MREEIKSVNMGLLSVDADDIKAEDMPTSTMKDIFELCGKDCALRLLIYMAGNIIQVPARPWVKIQENYIMKNYDYSAQSIKRIARTIGVSEKYVRDVLKTRVKSVPCEGQINFLHGNEEPEAAGSR